MDLVFYKTPGETWAAMRADIEAAKKSIELEQYIVKNDEVGNGFLDLFLRKQREGVQVRLLLDRVGSRSVYGTERIAGLINEGAQVRFYNPLSLRNIFMPGRWFPRNHVKTLLIDSEIAYIGGVCMEAPMKDWRDSQVRFTGPLAAQIEERFSLERINWRTKVRRLVSQDVDRHLPFEYLVHRPRLGPNPIYLRLVRAVRGARESVDLVTPYFLPPYGLRRAMAAAARRGVRVRVMMSEATDAYIVDCASHSYFPWMYRNGIEIQLYRKSMMHAKYVIVDDSWATLGSTNIDYLSLRQNREANIVIRDPKAVAAMRRNLDADLKDCIEAGGNYWRDLPWRHRLLGYLGRYVRRFL